MISYTDLLGHMRRIHMKLTRILHHHGELVPRILHHRRNDGGHKRRRPWRQIHNHQRALHCVIRPKVVFAHAAHAKHIVGAGRLRRIHHQSHRLRAAADTAHGNQHGQKCDWQETR